MCYIETGGKYHGVAWIVDQEDWDWLDFRFRYLGNP